MTYPYYLPEEKMTVVMLINSNANVLGSWFMFGSIIRTVAPNHPWRQAASGAVGTGRSGELKLALRKCQCTRLRLSRAGGPSNGMQSFEISIAVVSAHFGSNPLPASRFALAAWCPVVAARAGAAA